MQNTERVLYWKTTQTEPISSSYRFDIISVTNLEHTNPREQSQPNVDARIMITAIGKSINADSKRWVLMKSWVQNSLAQIYLLKKKKKNEVNDD